MALIIDRVFNVFEPEDSGPQNIHVNDDVPNWARAAVSRGYERGILQSTWAAFRAAQPVTRAEAAMFLAWNVKGMSGSQSPAMSPLAG